MTDDAANRTRPESSRPNRLGRARRNSSSQGDGAPTDGSPQPAPPSAKGASDAASNLEVELAVYRQALERSRADMQAFAYSVSHDLRAPLRAIQGFSKILLEDFAAQLDPEAQQFLRHIVQNTQQLSSQMDDLLRFSRAGRHSPTKIDLETEPLLREAAGQVEAETQSKLALEVGVLPRLFADPVLLRQALVELLGNAHKFSRNKPGMTIEVTGRADPGAVSIAIRDNGVGFDPAHAGKLFQVFQKIHSPGEFPGNGIGLAIVRRIVEAHGGCVEAQATPDQGACFTISLPHAHADIPLDCAPSNGPGATHAVFQNSA